jgi:hypothetical protein
MSSGHAGIVNLRILGDPNALSVTSAESRNRRDLAKR